MWIIDQNRALSKRAAKRFPHFHTTMGDKYPEVVDSLLQPGGIIVDVGGGRYCAVKSKTGKMATVIAVDISAEELSCNRDVQDRRVGDVTKRIPVDDESVDIVASRFLVEHLQDTKRFIDEALRVLRPGGSFVTLFPNKNAPFSVINRALPKDLGRRIATALKPTAKEMGVFPAFYDLCTPNQFICACKSSGFSEVNCEVDYFQSSYFFFCFPLAMVSLCYEWMVYKLSMKALSSLVLVTARK